MESGEWTKTEALVLESAIEALTLQSREKLEPRGEPLVLITRIRLLKFVRNERLSGVHRDDYLVLFESNKNPRERVRVEVSLFCHGRICSRRGHYWTTRMVSIDHVDILERIGEAWEYESKIGQHLYRTSFDFVD